MSARCTETATKMDPELKRKWVEALRSGEYKQVHGTYEADGGYCCLGVLAKVCGEHHIIAERRTGLPFNGPLIRRNDGTVEFADNPQSFAQIADWIEANL